MNPFVLHCLTLTNMKAWERPLTGEEDPHSHQQDGNEQDNDPYQYDF